MNIYLNNIKINYDKLCIHTDAVVLEQQNTFFYLLLLMDIKIMIKIN